MTRRIAIQTGLLTSVAMVFATFAAAQSAPATSFEALGVLNS